MKEEKSTKGVTKKQPTKKIVSGERGAINTVKRLLTRWNHTFKFNIKHIETVIDPPDPKKKSKDDSGRTEHLVAVFSAPQILEPVPQCVVYVFFKIRDGHGSYRFESQCVEHSTKNGQKFEFWLHRLLKEKHIVRMYQNLCTAFEDSRMHTTDYEEEDAEALEAMEEEERLKQEKSKKDAAVNFGTDKGAGTEIKQEGSCEKKKKLKEFVSSMFSGVDQTSESFILQNKAKLGSTTIEDRAPEANDALCKFLANIFDAADEDSEGYLTHKEVRDLLYSTPLGLEEWDILLLLTTAPEDETTGLIEYGKFVEIGPKIIEALHKRRLQYKARGLPCITVHSESVELCYGDEIEETNRQLRDVFWRVWNEEGGKHGDGMLHRTLYRKCLYQKLERFTPQEIQLIMQMVEETDEGAVRTDEITPLIINLRTESLHNAMVETDIASLRVHLILLMRQEGLQEYDLTCWSLRNVLLKADQLCLSRMQVHVLLSIIHPNEYGWIDVRYALRVLCVVIPYFFDAVAFTEKATQTAREQQIAQEQAELEELRGFQGATNTKLNEEEAEDETNVPDKEAVEKALIHVGNLFMPDRTSSMIELPQFLSAVWHESIQQTGLLDHELRGFVAEAQVDAKGQFNYIEHVRLWVPIIFELRKSRWYEPVLSQDWSGRQDNLANLSMYESTFPILPYTPNAAGASWNTLRRISGGERRSITGITPKGSPGQARRLSMQNQNGGTPGKRRMSADATASPGSEHISQRTSIQIGGVTLNNVPSPKRRASQNHPGHGSVPLSAMGAAACFQNTTLDELRRMSAKGPGSSPLRSARMSCHGPEGTGLIPNEGDGKTPSSKPAAARLLYRQQSAPMITAPLSAQTPLNNTIPTDQANPTSTDSKTEELVPKSRSTVMGIQSTELPQNVSESDTHTDQSQTLGDRRLPGSQMSALTICTEDENETAGSPINYSQPMQTIPRSSDKRGSMVVPKAPSTGKRGYARNSMTRSSGQSQKRMGPDDTPDGTPVVKAENPQQYASNPFFSDDKPK